MNRATKESTIRRRNGRVPELRIQNDPIAPSLTQVYELSLNGDQVDNLVILDRTDLLMLQEWIRQKLEEGS